MLVAAPAAALGANLYQDFQRDGAVNPCKYSDNQLRKGLDNLPPDLEQYSPGFGDQLRNGRGNCGGAGGNGGIDQGGGQQQDQGGAAAGGGGGGGGPKGPSGGPQIAKPPAPKAPLKSTLAGAATPRIDAEPSGSDAPGWLLLLGVLALFGAMVAIVTRRRGWSAERFTKPLGAAFAEAGGRTADALTTTRERLRPGRS